MDINSKEMKELEILLKPVNEWLYKNGNLYTRIIIEQDIAEILTGEAGLVFVRDEGRGNNG